MSVGVLPVLSDINPHIEMVSNLSNSCIFKNDDFVSLSKIISENMVAQQNETQGIFTLSFFCTYYAKKICKVLS